MKKKLIPLCIGNFAWDTILVNGRNKGIFPGGIAFRILLAFSLMHSPCNYIITLGKEKKWDKYISLLKKNNVNVLKKINVNKDSEFILNYKSNKANPQLQIVAPNNMDSIVEKVTKDLLSRTGDLILGALGYKNEKKIIDKAKSFNKKIYYIFHESNICSEQNNVKEKYKEIFNDIECLFLNGNEARMITNEKNDFIAGEEISKFAKRVFLTRGNDDVLVFDKGKLVYKCKNIDCSVLDTSGAGDLFAGGVIVGLILTNNDLIAATRFGVMITTLSLSDYSTNQVNKLLN